MLVKLNSFFEYSRMGYAHHLKRLFGAKSVEAKSHGGFAPNDYYSLTTEFGEIRVAENDTMGFDGYDFEIDFVDIALEEKEKLSEILRRMVTKIVEIAVTDSTHARAYHLTKEGVREDKKASKELDNVSLLSHIPRWKRETA